jgi:hypothetical protein
MKRETIWEYKIRVKQEAKDVLALAKKQEAERLAKKNEK